jgi:RNA polymerase sigma-70 factor (ECF subfamily)
VTALTLCSSPFVGYRLVVEQAVASAARDDRLVVALRAGEEAAFTALVQEHSAAMLRVAQLFVSSRAVAEEVVQEAWIGVLRGIGRFEGRSSLKTWIFRILTNTAKTRAVREGRSVPFSSLAGDEAGQDEPSVDPDRFLGESSRYTGHWNGYPAAMPEVRLLDAEMRDVIERTIATLPPAQATVISMRDIAGFEAEDVCNALGISETNQRVLLHRARSKVRRALEEYFAHEP